MPILSLPASGRPACTENTHQSRTLGAAVEDVLPGLTACSWQRPATGGDRCGAGTHSPAFTGVCGRARHPPAGAGIPPPAPEHRNQVRRMSSMRNRTAPPRGGPVHARTWRPCGRRHAASGPGLPLRRGTASVRVLATRRGGEQAITARVALLATDPRPTRVLDDRWAELFRRPPVSSDGTPTGHRWSGSRTARLHEC